MMHTHLSADEIMRYAQQIKLPEMGQNGQKKLKYARVLCIGLGGLGSPLLLYLAAAGVGKLGIVDHDKVELTNLQRQILYRSHHLGQAKSISAREQLLALNSSIEVNSYTEKLTQDNADELISQYDIIADGSDNFATRYLIHDTCFKFNKPYVYASAGQFQGYCAIFHANQENPCLRCLFPYATSPTSVNCATGGVIGVLPGLLGVLQATEIIKWILKIGTGLVKRLLMVDLLAMSFKDIYLSKNLDCQLCVYREFAHDEPISAIACPEDRTLKNYALSAKQLIHLLQKSNTSLVDVRSEAEHKDKNIGGKLIPLIELPYRLNELDLNYTIILYCLSGKRSLQAIKILLAAGFTSVKYLRKGAVEFF
jgi:sulfur-carrier protein adenylyltransferase/sulfurtransferase